MPSHKQIKHALHHPKELRQLIPDLATFEAAMVHTDLRVKLFAHLTKHPKSLHQLVKNYDDFIKLIQIDWDYLITPECGNITFQEALLNMLASDSELLNKVVKSSGDLVSVAYLIKDAPLDEEKKAALQLNIIAKLITIENKFLDLYHLKTNATSRDCNDGDLAHDRHEWSAPAFALLAKMEVEKLFPIIFAEFRNNNFSNHNNFVGTLEDMRLRWKTFDQAAYEFCVTQLLAIYNLPTMKEPMYRNYLVGYLADCDRSRPKNVASLLSPELLHRMDTDPTFELNPQYSSAQALVASQQSSGLIRQTPDLASTITREPSPLPSTSPLVLVKSS